MQLDRAVLEYPVDGDITISYQANRAAVGVDAQIDLEAGIGDAQPHRVDFAHDPRALAADVSWRCSPCSSSLSGVTQCTCELLRDLAEAIATSQSVASIPAFIVASERHAEVADLLDACSAHRHKTLVNTFREGVAAGESPAGFDTEMALLGLSGAIFYRRRMTAEPLAAEDVLALVALVLGPKGRI